MTWYDSEVSYPLVAWCIGDFARVSRERLEERESLLGSGSYYVTRATYYCLLSPRFWPTPLISEAPHKNDGAASRCPVNPGEFTPAWSGSPSAPPVPEEAPGPCGFEPAPNCYGSRVAQLCGTMCVSAIGVFPDTDRRHRVGRSPCRMRGATVRDGWRCRASRRCGACGSRVSSPRCSFVKQSPGRCSRGR